MTTDRPVRSGIAPFAKVLVGDDGRAGGRAAVAVARALAPDAELILAAAYPYDDHPSRMALAAYARLMREDAERQLARTREEAGAAEARVVAVPDTSPARALHDLAEDEAADLVVVGSSHRSPAGRVLLGDVARDVLHGAPCAVAIAPREATSPRRLEVVGVAYDASAEADAALALAARIAEASGARLDVLYVVESDFIPSLAGMAFDVGDILRDLREDAQEAVDAAVARLPVPAEGRAVTGSAQEHLAELAGRADLVVCGSRGWGTLRRVMLGSTSDRLIHHAPCPVLVVPRGTGAAQGESEGDRATETPVTPA